MPLGMEELNRAKELLDEYLEYNLEEDVKILGRDHPYNDATIGEIQDAYYLIREWFDER